MRNRIYALIFFSALLTGSLSACDSPRGNAHASRDHFRTGYVPWGIDEFELFGLTKQGLDKQFEGELHFQEKDSTAVFSDVRSSHFYLEFDKDKVSKVQRVFIDGAGCHIKGPLLTSKRAALEFSVDGLSNLDNLSKEEKSKLETAQTLLKDLAK